MTNINIDPNLYVGHKVLITTREWFLAPDGRSYKAVYGTLRGIIPCEAAFGFKINTGSTNWFLEVGDMLIMGCQVLYGIKSDTIEKEPIENWTTHEGQLRTYTPPYSSIYISR